MSATTAAGDDAPRRRPGRPPIDSSEGVVETRELILRQAERLFMQRGFAAVSVGDVAEAVGVTKPTLYYHFGDKEGMYAAMLVALMTRVGAHVRRVTLLAKPSSRPVGSPGARLFPQRRRHDGADAPRHGTAHRARARGQRLGGV